MTSVFANLVLVSARLRRSVPAASNRNALPLTDPIRNAVISIALALAALSIPAPAAAGGLRHAALVIDANTGAILHQDNADAIIHPASLTKMMTLYLTFEALETGKLRLNTELPVSRHAENQKPSKLGLENGETITVENAVLGVATKSANDAAVVLAEALGGSESAFAERMTTKARELGLRHTLFRNASGLPNKEQVTTARDMATLGRSLLRDWPKHYHYFSRRTFWYKGASHANHNHLMERYPGMDGIKTGYIVASGFNLVASAVRDGHRLVAVVLGGQTRFSRDNEVAALLDQGFRKLGAGPHVANAGGDGGLPRATEVAQHGGAPAGGGEAAGDNEDDTDRGGGGAKANRTQVAAHPTAPSYRWALQLGTFKSHAAGQKALAQARKKLGGLGSPALAKAKQRKHTVYRASLTGFDSEKAARAACGKLKGQSCSVVKR